MIKICKHCGKQFETNNPQKIYCDGPHYRPCPVCGKPVIMIDNDFSRPPRCCSNECSKIKRQKQFKIRTCEICGKEFQPKSGSQKICSENHYINCEICGKQMIWNSLLPPQPCSKECRRIRTKIKNIEKFGVEHPMQNSDGSQNARKTHVDDIQEKSRTTWPRTVGTDNPSKSPDVIDKIKKQFADKLTEFGIEYEFEFPVETKCYDIKLKNSNALIEINPSYTHNAFGNHWDSNGLPQDYHLEKTQIANRNGYRCIHVWDWDNWDKIIQLLEPRKAIYARSCSIFLLHNKTADAFLRQYHIQSSCKGDRISLGLIYNDEIYQVMTFGKPRYSSKQDAELLRLCTKPGYRVIGGASKLFKFFTSTYEIPSVISYCDISKFNGDVHEQMNMKLIRTTPPQEIWSKDAKKITANLLRQRGFDQLFRTNYGKGTSNEQLMLEHGWLPVYDCGQKVYEYR